MARNRDPGDTDPPDDQSGDDGPRTRRRTPIEVPADRAATLAELAGVTHGIDVLERRITDLERRDRASERVRAEWIGSQGKGRLGRMEEDVNVLEQRLSLAENRVAALETWRTALVAKSGVLMTLGGGAAGVLSVLIVEVTKFLLSR